MDGKLTTPPPENGNEQQLYDDVFIDMQKQQYGKDVSKDYKRVVRRRAESFILRDGFVYLKRKMEKEGIEGQEREWIIDKTAQMRVIEACHDDKFGQYMSLMSVWHALPAVYEFTLSVSGTHTYCFYLQGEGTSVVTKQRCSRYYWQDMTMQIRDYVQTCDTCQRSNPKLLKSSSVLHPIPVTGMVPDWH